MLRVHASAVPAEMDRFFSARWRRWRRTDECAAPNEHGGTWLGLISADCSFRAGCTICKRQRTGTAWAEFNIRNVHLLKFHHVKQHSMSRLHRLATTTSTDHPSSKEWEQALGNFKNARKGTKAHAMRYCLDEGLRVVQHRLFAKMTTIALSQGARNNKLLMRLTASTESFERVSFILGQKQLTGTDAYAVASTTKTLLADYAKRLDHVSPYGAMATCRTAAAPCAAVLQVLHAKTEAIVTDAASDEMKAGRLLTGNEASAHCTCLLPSVKLHCRDPTHAAGRFLIPWQSDAYLWWVFNLLVKGKGSPTKLVQHSPALQLLFGQHVSALESCPCGKPQHFKNEVCEGALQFHCSPFATFGALFRSGVEIVRRRCCHTRWQGASQIRCGILGQYHHRGCYKH